jgi:hypothetical protein
MLPVSVHCVCPPRVLSPEHCVMLNMTEILRLELFNLACGQFSIDGMSEAVMLNAF